MQRTNVVVLAKKEVGPGLDHRRESHVWNKSPLTPLSPQPRLKLSRIEPLGHQPLGRSPPLRNPEIPMPRRILHQRLDSPRLGAILSLTDHSRPMCPLGKDARSSLVAMGDADLEGVVVEPSNQGTGRASVLLLEKLE